MASAAEPIGSIHPTHCSVARVLFTEAGLSTTAPTTKHWNLIKAGVAEKTKQVPVLQQVTTKNGITEADYKIHTTGLLDIKYRNH